MNESVYLSVCLAPDLLTQRVVASDAVMVVELIGPVGVGLLAQPTGGLDHVEDQFPGGEASFAGHER